MKKAMLYLLTATGFTALYQLLLMLCLSVTLAAQKPDWWPNGIFVSSDGLLAWMHLAQGFGVLLAALMVAWLIQRFFRARWLSLSFCATVLPLLFMALPFWQSQMLQSDLWWSGMLDTAKFLLLPPFCCWVMVRYQQLYSDNNS
jgi:hypothetical protein